MGMFNLLDDSNFKYFVSMLINELLDELTISPTVYKSD